MITTRFPLVTALTALLVAAGSASGQDRPTPLSTLPEIRTRYGKAKGDLKELSVKWTVTIELKVDAAIAKAIDGITDYPTVEAASAFKGANRFYEFVCRSRPGVTLPAQHPCRVNMAFDGEKTVVYMEYDRPTKSWPNRASINLGDHVNEAPVSDLYLAVVGLPKIPFNILNEAEPAPLDLSILRDETYRVEPTLQPAEDGTPCVLVVGGRDRIWLDPKLNLAVRQREWSTPDRTRPQFRVRAADHQQLIPGTWLPRTIYQDYFCEAPNANVPVDRPYKVGVARVSELSAGPLPDKMFRLELKPGTYVQDMTHFPTNAAGRTPIVRYTVPTDPSELNMVIENAVSTWNERTEATNQRRSIVRWIIYANIAIVVVCICSYLLYRRAKRNAAPINH
jgi:hypothetical protein